MSLLHENSSPAEKTQSPWIKRGLVAGAATGIAALSLYGMNSYGQEQEFTASQSLLSNKKQRELVEALSAQSLLSKSKKDWI